MSAQQTPTYREAWFPTVVMVSLTVAMFVVMVVRSHDEAEVEAL